MTIKWQKDLDLGIPVIDQQHQRIVDLIVDLHNAGGRGDQALVGGVIDSLIDYTESHFAFEEALMEDAGYVFTRAHKKLHERFIDKAKEYKYRHVAGEDVAHELSNSLTIWLFEHIRKDDRDYQGAVKEKMINLTSDANEGGWLSRSVKRFFR
ncbi:MAG TPA: bacteriohemerythrin [Thioalkalivibrio sp.]|nr:bacteriohemerythrin [Thioalkalivibrio sp.]